MDKMLLSELFKELSINVEKDGVVEGITCDSRDVRPGVVFVCIDGVKVDGHDFAKQAEEKGALLIVAERDVACENQLIVSATRIIWPALCARWFGNPTRKLKIIGITGTNGKTSVTYFLKSVLEACGQKVGLVGTVQNMIGDRSLPATQTTPDAYDLQSMFALMVAAGCSYAVMEVSSHALDQNRVGGIMFDGAIFTNLSQDHLDYHHTMAEYLQAKKKMFDLCKIAFINLDDDYAQPMMEGLSCPIVTYSAYKDIADYTAKNIVPRSDGVNFELVSMEGIDRVRFPVPGKFSVYNALAAATCAISLGNPFADVVKSLSEVEGVKGRVEVVHSPDGGDFDFTVIIDYAHTPDSLEKVGETLKEGTQGRLVTLFGCGGDRDKTKRPLMAVAATKHSDFIIVTSDNPRTEVPEKIVDDIIAGLDGISYPKSEYTVIVDRKEAIGWAIEHAKPGDVILLAGKGHETYQVLKEGSISFDEREIVKEAFDKLRKSRA